MQRERLAILVIVLSLAAMALVGVAVVSPIGAGASADSVDRTVAVEAGGADAASNRATPQASAVAPVDDPTAVRASPTVDADALVSADRFR